MRWSELTRKELVNIADGSKRGPFPKLDLVIDPKDGQVVSLLLPAGGFLSRPGQEIPWTAVKKISADLILYADEAVRERNKPGRQCLPG